MVIYQWCGEYCKTRRRWQTEIGWCFRWTEFSTRYSFLYLGGIVVLVYVLYAIHLEKNYAIVTNLTEDI